MKRWLLALLLLLCPVLPAAAQQAQIVAVCGVPPPPYSNLGSVLPLTMDVTGKLCSNATGGGGGTPGGLNTQLQYNAAGSFGGIAGATSNGTTVTFAANDLILGGVTGSTQCLQASTTGIVTGTGAACGGAVSSVSNADGTLTISPTTGAVVASLALGHANTWTAAQTFNANDLILGGVTGSTQCLQAGATGIVTGTGSACGSGGGGLTVGTTTVSGGAAGNMLYTDGALLQATGGVTWVGTGQLTHALGTATVNEKALNITGTFNAPAIATTAASGTGTTATITFAAQPTAYPIGSTVVVAGVTPAGYNGTFVVTASSTTSVSYASATTGAQTVAGTVQQLFDAPLFMNITNTASNASSLLVDFQTSGSSIFQLTPVGQASVISTTGTQPGFFIKLNTDSFARFNIGLDGSDVPIISWGAGTGVRDIFLARDGAGIIGDRNGGNAQTFRVYNIFTSATSFERGILDWQANANVFTIGTEKGSGGGSVRNMEFVIGGVNQLDYGITNAGAWTSASFIGVASNGFVGTLNAGAARTGFIYASSDVMTGKINGTSTWQIDSTYIRSLGTGQGFSLNSDTAINRNAAGVLEINNGTAGTFRDLTLRHLRGNGAPTANVCAGFTLATGSSDLAGQVTYTSATTCSITFASAFTNAPFCMIQPVTALATTQVATTTTGLTATFGTAQTAFQYHCLGL